VIIVTALFIFSGYVGMTKIDVLPKMYSSEYPQEYMRLIEQAEKGLDKQTKGKYAHEVYKQHYDLFLEKNLEKENNKDSK
ncbi:MAG: hypothetical protein R3345_13890, partial [Fulvivirga sp.]|nr:hypothetical protein [Fulvivirga sp.]